ncbi:MAG: MerR family transcriptional regulator, partial [Desulfobacterales bacterium]
MIRKNKSAQKYKIGEFAEKAGVPVSTVNYYVKQGLIRPQMTTPSGYRIFSEDGLRTISAIRELQTEYLPLHEIKKRLLQKGRLRRRPPQMSLPFEEFELAPVTFRFPSTRYQGSKLKLVEWIWQNIKHLRFETALDAFGGTGCVAYMLKAKNKEITYNDILRFNHYIGLALIENDKEILSSDDLRLLLTEHKGVKYSTFIHDAFHDIYFTDEENAWLDMVIRNVQFLKNRYKQALAYYALFQACIIKRPYNLFHRKNLYIRTAEVKRSFGNKITWDTPFAVHFV